MFQAKVMEQIETFYIRLLFFRKSCR